MDLCRTFRLFQIFPSYENAAISFLDTTPPLLFKEYFLWINTQNRNYWAKRNDSYSIRFSQKQALGGRFEYKYVPQWVMPGPLVKDTGRDAGTGSKEGSSERFVDSPSPL